MSSKSEPPDPNAADQRAAWNGAMGQRWLAQHEQLDRMLEPLGAALFDQLPPGVRSAADIGCGTGETTVRLAAAVPDAAVTGFDISAPLIATAAAAAPDLEFAVADAGADDLGGPYDLVASRFGTMFFPEPAAAFAHIGVAMRPGATLRMLTWQAPAENEWVRIPLGAASQLVDLPGPPPDPTAPGPFSLADPARTADLLGSSGFVDVRHEPIVRRLGLPGSPADAAAFLLAVLPTGPLLDSLEADDLDRVVAAVADAIPRNDEGSALHGAAWLVTARTAD